MYNFPEIAYRLVFNNVTVQGISHTQSEPAFEISMVDGYNTSKLLS